MQILFFNFGIMEFQGDYLRVITPVYDSTGQLLIENGRIVSRETNMPMSARKGLEEENENYRRHGKQSLCHKIEVVHCDPIPDVDPRNLPSFMAGAVPLLKNIPLVKPVVQQSTPGKRGRPKKQAQ